MPTSTRFKLTFRDISNFQEFIFSWWQTNRRDFPWRHTRDPYRITVSEIMLQQTQADRVVLKYTEFLAAYPTVSKLAACPKADVLRIWKGLGYNRRALYLYNIAKIITKVHHNKFPFTEQQLIKLPGVGRYTARATMVFAYGIDVAMVDTNIRKILTHFFYSGRLQKDSVIQKTADMLVPKGKSWEWHQALMDYGAFAFRTATRPDKKRKAIVPFKESDRFFRGRMLDLLRVKRQKGKALIRSMARDFKRPQTDMVRILDALVKDGLAQRRKGLVALPE